MLVEAQLADGDREAAAASAQRLAALAAGSPDGWVAARAAAAAGHLTAAVGDAEQAAGLFRAALATFTRLDLPVDAAQVRLALAHACARVPAVAVAEATTALETFDRVGAIGQADATAALLHSLGPRPAAARAVRPD